MDAQTKLNEEEIESLKNEYPLLPIDYIEYMTNIGWGETRSGKMIYQGPIPPQDIYGNELLNKNIVLLGDDFQGYCLGFNLEELSYGEVTNIGEWESWGKGEGLSNYV